MAGTEKRGGRLRVLERVPEDAVVLEPRGQLERMFHQLPVALEVGGLPLRYLWALTDVAEGRIADMGDARSGSRTSWDLYGEFAEALPDAPVGDDGEVTPEAGRVLAEWGRRAAREFGPLGFGGDAAVWASWLATEHAAFSEPLADKTWDLLPLKLESGQVWRRGELLGRLRTRPAR